MIYVCRLLNALRQRLNIDEFFSRHNLNGWWNVRGRKVGCIKSHTRHDAHKPYARAHIQVCQHSVLSIFEQHDRAMAK